ncbi:MAG TPA: nucleotidyltransferase family protein [Dehalococcoidia bacterium]|nr:nucleotidyltransferase family protein [Dehalococcoidia bacterium]
MPASLTVQDWQKVSRLAVRHRVSGWLLRAASRPGGASLLEPRCAEVLLADVLQSAMKALSLDSVLEEMILGLQAIGVQVMVLKGATIATRYYPDAALRPYNDVDLLVPLGAWSVVDSTLRSKGYGVLDDHGGVESATPNTFETPFEITYAHGETGLKVDVHFDQLQIGLRPRSLDSLWDRAQAFTVGRATAGTPQLDDLCLLLLVHLQRHGFERLIWFKDLDLILRRHEAEFAWDKLTLAARDEGVANSVRYGLHLLKALFDTPLPDATLLDRELTRVSLLDQVLWREARILDLDTRPLRLRRLIQFIPREGLRGSLPSLVFMGRKGDKLSALVKRHLRISKH